MNDDPPAGSPRPGEDGTQAPRPLTGVLLAATIAAGVLQFILTLIAPAKQSVKDGIGSRIGAVIAGSALLPLIVIGLFSIGRRFRTSRSRAIILLSVWCVVALSELNQIGIARRTRAELSAVNDAPAREVASVHATPPTSAPSSIPDAPDASGFDFSPGSDQRLIALIEHAQEQRYHSAVAAYARACASRPKDAALALERVRFIAHFNDAEDVSIASAADDYAAALGYLTGNFPDVPGTVLYQLQNYFDPHFDARADRYARMVPSWPPADQAAFYLLRARAAEHGKNSERALQYARTSFDRRATPEAGVLLATELHGANQDELSRGVLSNPVLDSGTPYLRKQQMDLLFDLGLQARAVALYRALSARQPAIVSDSATAMRLAHAGELGAARGILAKLSLNSWNRENVARDRFRLELQFGSAGEALDAYRRLRSFGLGSDPFSRYRIALAWKHPRLGWNLDDAVSLLSLDVLMLLAIALPLLLVLPVHYWSLLRTRAGKTGGWSHARWGLREIWISFGVGVASGVLGFWVFQPDALRWLYGSAAPRAISPSPPAELLPAQTIWWAGFAAVTVILIWRARAWSFLGPGRWSFGKAAGAGVVVVLAARLLLGVFMVFFPQATDYRFAAVEPFSQRICEELLKDCGPFGLVAVAAIFVPLLEEVQFRGILLQGLARHIPFGWANVIQALLFAALHGSLFLAPFYFAIGLACGLLVRRSAGLFAAIAAHSSNNLIASFAIILAQARHAAGFH
ncbi:MAG: type II CAAX endopeptidase family protein [Opitutaceae bacterium]|jgi:membrane protease YdiL (CAAX protease family)